ncbi:MAG: glycosyltransferase family 2 protein [Rhodopseudomonas palustris]|nr:glycosyltransferase family 2 protein [Rhodopseudomonas palustris]
MRAERGRARQMNAGAAAARGDVLLFLHADTRAAGRRRSPLIARGAGDGRRAWGRFDVAHRRPHRPWLPIVAALMNLRSRLSGIATGDQAIFVTRAAFDAVGGFPDQPLMEDVEITQPPAQAIASGLHPRERVLTSGRRWEARGAWRTILLMWRLRWRYWRGASPEDLARGTTDERATRIVILAKAPVAGHGQDAADSGARRASRRARLARRVLLAHAAARRVAAGRGAGRAVRDARHRASRRSRALARRHGMALRPQGEGDLGARMAARRERALAGGDARAADRHRLPRARRGATARAPPRSLEHSDAVLVPDVRRRLRAARAAASSTRDRSSGMPWSTAEVAARTIECFRDARLAPVSRRRAARHRRARGSALAAGRLAHRPSADQPARDRTPCLRASPGNRGAAAQISCRAIASGRKIVEQLMVPSATRRVAPGGGPGDVWHPALSRRPGSPHRQAGERAHADGKGCLVDEEQRGDGSSAPQSPPGRAASRPGRRTSPAPAAPGSS